jgi:hypothetical protein
MSALLDFFGGGTARIQALLYAAIAMLVVVLALVVYGEYWRAQAWKARDQVDQVKQQLVAAIDQEKVLAGALQTCNAGVEASAKAATAALAAAAAAQARADAAAVEHRQASAKLEALLRQPTKPGAGCPEARAAIAADRAAKKAGAAP